MGKIIYMEDRINGLHCYTPEMGQRKPEVKIAGSFDEFVEKITQAERKALNTPFGQEITERLLKMKLEENPDMTAEEWQDTKSQFLTFLFAMFVKETPQAMAELAQHTWDELQVKEV